MSDDFPSNYDGAVQVLKRLRGPGGCPWDREQTHESLKEMLLEECYELIEAVEENDTAKMVEELGDVLLHVIFQMNIAEEQGEFGQEQVFSALIDKLVRRHPHVFGGVEVSGTDDIVANWDDIKRGEKGDDGSILDGVPRTMPALSYAQAIQRRAARSGFDWDDMGGVLDKVSEELSELADSQSDVEREHEMGDLLFSIVNASRWMEVDAETSLRQTNARFYGRFVHMERLCRERGLSFAELSLDEKESLWGEAKAAERD